MTLYIYMPQFTPTMLFLETKLLIIAELIPKSIALLMNGHKVTMYGPGADVKRALAVCLRLQQCPQHHLAL